MADRKMPRLDSTRHLKYLSSSVVGIDDTAYNEATWNGSTLKAPSQNAVRDKIETMTSNVEWGSSWDGDTDTAPTKNVVYDRLEVYQHKFHAGHLGLADAIFTITNAGKVSGGTL